MNTDDEIERRRAMNRAGHAAGAAEGYRWANQLDADLNSTAVNERLAAFLREGEASHRAAGLNDHDLDAWRASCSAAFREKVAAARGRRAKQRPASAPPTATSKPLPADLRAEFRRKERECRKAAEAASNPAGWLAMAERWKALAGGGG